MFDLLTSHIINAPEIRGWRETARIEEIKFANGMTSVRFTGPEWPGVRPAGWDGDVQFTLWLFRKVSPGGVDPYVAGSAFIQFWRGRVGSGSSTDPDVPSVYHKNWFYAPRWAELYHAGPILPGEEIGFLVSSGNCRDSAGPFGPEERSNLVSFVYKSDSQIVGFLPDDVPTPVPTPAPLPSPDPLTDVVARLARIETALSAIKVPVPVPAPVYRGSVGPFSVTLKPVS